MKITQKHARVLGKKNKINYKLTPFREWWIGLNIETEHSNITNGSISILAKIVMAHLEESPRYYYFLEKMEKKF